MDYRTIHLNCYVQSLSKMIRQKLILVTLEAIYIHGVAELSFSIFGNKSGSFCQHFYYFQQSVIETQFLIVIDQLMNSLKPHFGFCSALHDFIFHLISANHFWFVCLDTLLFRTYYRNQVSICFEPVNYCYGRCGWMLVVLRVQLFWITTGE